ncbi:ferredoxin-2 [Anaeramoeba flamelloides]|uniref:Ferredoxin-2 n=1 Tax=Anaeramoeba flamelloides TaxID=1746091 RepID=A0AAV7Z2A2_9EUKA|nr:ferredoxin-2 [Anaeramoeba flamelloides]KAJ6244776.1 ferredoxin-2 [Anaeramoeba flamelloides]|eukprot:Anaeramoba_flamelloidesa84967_1900.p1 GENE.a84967_1900~~a84967_1900.p1  ORF type:complete len:131 (+),score=29.94 a84967_1900:37-429(+)
MLSSVLSKQLTKSITSNTLKMASCHFSKIFVQGLSGKKHVVEFEEGDTLYEAAEENGIKEIMGVCGGNMSCTRCQVYVGEHKDKFAEADEDELDALDRAFKRQDDSRLACALELNDDVDGVTIIQAPRKN